MCLRKILFISAAVLVSLFCVMNVQANSSGAVYTMTNDPDDNQIVVFSRDEQGLLTLQGNVSTGGKGSGGGVDPLASQGSLVLVDNGESHHGRRFLGKHQKRDDNNWLLAVNAGSNDISVFKVKEDGIKLVDRTGTGGNYPVSVTVANNIVYVLNGGEPANITGFWLGRNGKLWQLPHTTRLLGDGAFGQVEFDPYGRSLVITDKANNNLLVYRLWFFLPEKAPVISPSNGAVPFAVDHDAHGHLLVAEAGSNAVSSYKLKFSGELETITASEPNGQIATCWIVVNQRGNVFTTNPGTNSLASFQVDKSGVVTLLNGTAGSGQTPLDADISDNGNFLYAVDPTLGGVDMFRIEADGSLTSLGLVDAGLSIYAQGLAAF